jgi:hypothetical protein
MPCASGAGRPALRKRIRTSAHASLQARGDNDYDVVIHFNNYDYAGVILMLGRLSQSLVAYRHGRPMVPSVVSRIRRSAALVRSLYAPRARVGSGAR